MASKPLTCRILKSVRSFREELKVGTGFLTGIFVQPHKNNTTTVRKYGFIKTATSFCFTRFSGCKTYQHFKWISSCVKPFALDRIKVAKERVYVPAAAVINIEHERGKQTEETEFQMKWKT